MRWFKHDSDAHTDAKLRRVRLKYGMEGYGLYWYCVELIARGVEAHNLTFELEHDAEIISHDTGIHYKRVQDMMLYMVEQGLFENSSGTITCMKLAKRIDQSMTSNPDMRRIIQQMRAQNHDGVMTPSTGGHDGISDHHERLDQIRLEEKKNKGRKAPKFTPPTVEEVRTYCRSRGNAVDPQRFCDFYAAKGWMVGKNRMKDWKAAVRTWEANTPHEPTYGDDAR